MQGRASEGRARPGRVAVAGLALVLAAAAAPVVAPGAPAAAADPPAAWGSVHQVPVTGLVPGQPVELHHGGGAIDSGTADAQGAFLFRDVPAGAGYTVVQGAETSEEVTVTGLDDVPPQALYDDQDIDAARFQTGQLPNVTDHGAYDYIETRDGTTLSALVSLPGDPEDGPYPVVVEYSGYDPSDPEPSRPSPTQLAAVVSGYAWVGINMRGTGCSGGAYDYFETLQALDGYDAIEAIAAQDWSIDDQIAMAGISFPGISQLFVAPTRPPHLAAISPLSVIADTYRSTLYPGGILNSGFATSWAADRDADAQPAAAGWAQERIAEGDTTCEDNQLLRLQRLDIVPRLDPAAFYDSSDIQGDDLAPRTLVGDIDVPVFLAGAFQDEQTGGQWPTMIDDFADDVPLRVVMTNGSHTEPLGPEVALELMEFLDIYVREQTPSISNSLIGIMPIVYEQIYGVDDVALPAPTWDGTEPFAEVKAAYEAEPPIAVHWENGAAGADGSPCPTAAASPDDPACPAQYPYASFTSRHASWPAPGTVSWTQQLLPDGAMAPGPTSGLAEDEPRSVATYRYDDSVGTETFYSGAGDSIWRTDATYEWDEVAQGDALSFVTAPMDRERRLLGSASVDLWLRSTAPDVDVEVTLSEITPDGDEVYIQTGWLRASHRAEGPGSTERQPFQTHLTGDAQPLSDTEWSLARVEVFPFAHVLRPGSRLRLHVDAPGGDRPLWEFASLDAPADTQVDVSLSDAHPSRLVLPLLTGVDAPDERPACGSLRSQPCRTFEPSHRPTEVVLEATGEDTATVTWAPPAGGAAPEGYEVVLEPGGISQEVGAGETSAGFAGLAPGQYTATVAAIRGGEADLASSPSPLEALPVCAPFPDVPEDHPFCADIAWMSAEGIAGGYADGGFHPSAPVSRQAMSAFLFRLAGEPAFEAPGEASFADVPVEHPFFAEVEWMSAEGITGGYADGGFHPSAPVSRQAMSAFLFRLAGEPAFEAPGEASFSDVPVGHPFFPEVEWMAEEGISTGFGDGGYQPASPVSRQAMAAFLHRLADGPGVAPEIAA